MLEDLSYLFLGDSRKPFDKIINCGYAPLTARSGWLGPVWYRFESDLQRRFELLHHGGVEFQRAGQ